MKIYCRLRNESYQWNHKRVYRVYKLMYLIVNLPEVPTSMQAEWVIRILERVIWYSGKPENIRVDNGPEFIADLFKSWCNRNGINIKYIQPGKPTQNSFIERFNGSYRRGVFDAYLFDNLNQVRKLTQNWMKDYNEFRPHEALGDLSPIAYFENMKKLNEFKEAI